jgi:hypothetical protein
MNGELWIESPRYRFNIRHWGLDAVKELRGAVFMGDGSTVVQVVRGWLTI